MEYTNERSDSPAFEENDMTTSDGYKPVYPTNIRQTLQSAEYLLIEGIKREANPELKPPFHLTLALAQLKVAMAELERRKLLKDPIDWNQPLE